MEEKQEQKEYHKWLMQICPICGKEFACNKTHHVYMERVGRNVCIIAASCLLRSFKVSNGSDRE
ncbi:MAG: hypothetical protein ACLR2G_02020 [Phascolarctobacterium faecium]